MVRDLNFNDEIVGGVLGVTDMNVPPTLFEDVGVDQFVLAIGIGQLHVLRPELMVGKFHSRVGICGVPPRVAWQRIEVPPLFLGVFRVVAFVSVEPEEPLFEVVVATVPERHREAPDLVSVREAEHAVFVPPIGPRPGVVIGEIAPGVARCAVVLAHGPPRPFGNVRTPIGPSVVVVEKALLFGSCHEESAPGSIASNRSIASLLTRQLCRISQLVS